MKKILLIVFAILAGFFQAQTKKQTTTKQKTEKKWVNPVKLTKEERNRPYMDEVLKTRDSLTPQEAERRRKNIAVGNPFAKYGVYPKIATLSKGKYLEFHDMDSVVSIGSVRFNRKTKSITEFREIDLSDPDAQPYLDTAGRWISPDPLSEEFTSWSPYNISYNNPISNIDPDGRAAFDWVHNRETNSIYWNNNATSQATAGTNETYLGKSGTYTTVNGSTTALNANGSYTNNSLIGGLGITPNLDPLIHAGDSAPAMSVATFGTPSDGSYIRETPSLNTQEGAFANPSSQLASTMLTAMQEAPLAVVSEIAVLKIGNYLNTTKTIEQVAVHGNSLNSTKPTWGYKLFSEDGNFLKNGITSQAKAESRYTKKFMADKYMEKQLFPNRRTAYEWEAQQNKILKGPLNKNNH
ncbi:hypothetical protein [Chryseobacterium sp. Mn2064]|uniref:hypothetical protein n=1 Tax=Chryseobacterium sp. Mn2064 TaxID=3395263 RepID=UPI003BDD5C57